MERNRDKNDINPYRYCCEYYDRETNQYYLRARYYAPGVGRFTQEDPARAGGNWYSYCGGNPVAYSDSSGLTKQFAINTKEAQTFQPSTPPPAPTPAPAPPPPPNPTQAAAEKQTAADTDPTQGSGGPSTAPVAATTPAVDPNPSPVTHARESAAQKATEADTNSGTNVTPPPLTLKQATQLARKTGLSVDDIMATSAEMGSGNVAAITDHEANRRPNTGEPGSTWTAPNGDWRTYGPNGGPQTDYDHDDHGYPDSHPHDENGGHYHDWPGGVHGEPYVPESAPPAPEPGPPPAPNPAPAPAPASGISSGGGNWGWVPMVVGGIIFAIWGAAYLASGGLAPPPQYAPAW